MTQDQLIVLLLVIVASLVTLAYVYVLFHKVTKIKVENKRIDEVHEYIHKGALTFLVSEYKIIIPFVIIVAVLLTVLGFIPGLEHAEAVGWQSALCFVVGSLFSAVAGWIGMLVATKANARTAEKAYTEGMSGALKVAFSGGSVLGLSVAGFGLLGLATIFILGYAITGNLDAPVKILAGYGLGCSMIALFARVGGGIYTKAADVGADIVGKIEVGIPEDDPRNPATIADNVGDNVGDIAGMGSDLTESFVGSIISCLTMAILTFAGSDNEFKFILFPILIAAIGTVSSVLSVIFVRSRNWNNPHKALNIATYVAAGVVVVATTLLALLYVGSWQLIFCVVAGLVAGIAVGFIAELYTSSDYNEVKILAKESQTGHATNIIAGFGSGMKSTALTILVLAAVIAVSYFFGEGAQVGSGGYGIALAAVGMLCTVGITVSVDGYGPISDNAGGIAQMADLPHEVREITDKLDSVGNTTAAIGKGFCIGSATLTSLAFIISYMETAKVSISLDQTPVLIGLLIGAMLPYFFSALTIAAVGRAANKMVEEIRVQFANNPGILEGTVVPDYNRCIEISTKASLKEMILPGLVAVLSPIAGGFILGVEGLGGILIGGLASAIMLAVFMANAGGAWDNAKKYVEEGNFGGKHSETHKAAVTGDTVGDPLKDTAGPSMDILIKLMSVIALILVPVLMNTGSLWDLLVSLLSK